MQNDKLPVFLCEALSPLVSLLVVFEKEIQDFSNVDYKNYHNLLEPHQNCIKVSGKILTARPCPKTIHSYTEFSYWWLKLRLITE